jgi:hypothetical protein
MNKQSLRSIIKETTETSATCGCKVCGKELSLRAEICIHCGDPDPFYFNELLSLFQQKRKLYWVAIILPFLLGTSLYLGGAFFPAAGILLGGLVFYYGGHFVMKSIKNVTYEWMRAQELKVSETAYINWRRTLGSIEDALAKDVIPG